MHPPASGACLSDTEVATVVVDSGQWTLATIVGNWDQIKAIPASWIRPNIYWKTDENFFGWKSERFSFDTICSTWTIFELKLVWVNRNCNLKTLKCIIVFLEAPEVFIWLVRSHCGNWWNTAHSVAIRGGQHSHNLFTKMDVAGHQDLHQGIKQ